FFQAEDGIRDRTVTGVQTCALPIWIPTAAILLSPTTWPRPFTSAAVLPPPPSVPRSTIPPDWVHEKAWKPERAVVLLPTTCPLSFTAVAKLKVPPSVPRSIAVTVGPAALASPLEALVPP